MRHDPEVAARGEQPTGERAQNEVEVGAAGQRVAAERHLELAGAHLEFPVEAEVDEDVALGFDGVAELARDLEFQPLEQRAFDLQTSGLPHGLGRTVAPIERRRLQSAGEASAQLHLAEGEGQGRPAVLVEPKRRLLRIGLRRLRGCLLGATQNSKRADEERGSATRPTRHTATARGTRLVAGWGSSAKSRA